MSARGQYGQEGQRSRFAPGASSDIDAGELEHELLGGSFDDGRQIGTQAQKLAAAGEKLGRVVGEKAEMADSHETFGDDMKQEASDKFLDWECSGFQPIPVFSIAVSEGNLSIVD